MEEISYSLNVIDSMFFKTDASGIKIYIRKKISSKIVKLEGSRSSD